MQPTWVEKLPDAVVNSFCRSDVLRIIGLPTTGSGNHRVVQRWIDKLQLDTSHFDYRLVLSKHRMGKSSNSKLTVEMVCTENSTYSSTCVRRLVKTKIPYSCSKCGLSDLYNNLPITLQLDHINGINNDHRLENLRWLCPNCHSQTITYGSRNRKSTRYVNSSQSKRKRTDDRPSIRKVARPSKEELAELMNTESFVSLGKRFGVSDNAVRKWAKRYGLL